MMEQMINILSSLHLSTIFVGSVVHIVLLGILIMEIFTVKAIRIKKLQINFIAVIFLIEFTLIAGFLANVSAGLFFLHIPELVVGIIALIFGISIIVRFFDLLNKKLVLVTICLGVVSISGVAITAVFDNTLGSFLDSVGSGGVTISIYFLIITSIMLGRKLNDTKND